MAENGMTRLLCWRLQIVGGKALLGQLPLPEFTGPLWLGGTSPLLAHDQRKQRVRHSHQRSKRARGHLLHDPAAVNLHSDFADAQSLRDLLVEQAARDECEDLALARRQLLVPRTQLTKLHSLSAQV